MEMVNKYKSPLGYAINDNNTDIYGVDHSGFSTRDELEYQFARQNKENQIIQNYNNQGITKNYPQAGTNFWGNSPDNNFGFGNSQISSNIENMQNTPVPNVQNQAYRIGEITSPALQETMFDSFFNHSPNAPSLWAQRAINQNTNMKVQEDGIFGSETINAMNKLSQDEIVKVNNAIFKTTVRRP